MFKTVKNRVWAFDAEWIPDPLAGKMLYKLPNDMPSKEIFEVMWEKGGATEDNPMPYLKTVVCRIVSIAAVERVQTGIDVKLHLLSLPRDSKDSAQTDEQNVVGTFLSKAERGKREGDIEGRYN